MGPACWLWDYLRRSKLAGFLVPLSGGIDSCATAVIVLSMCRIVMQAVKNGNEQVITDVRRIAGAYEKEGWMPETPQELCHNIFHSLYMGMAKQSSKETRSRAEELSKAIGSYHVDLDIDDIFDAQRDTFTKATGFEPKFKAHGGTQGREPSAPEHPGENKNGDCLRVQPITADGPAETKWRWIIGARQHQL